MVIEEKEGRINALTQLLANTQQDVIAVYEGLADAGYYAEIKEKRRNWKLELDELLGVAGVSAAQPAMEDRTRALEEAVLTVMMGGPTLV